MTMLCKPARLIATRRGIAALTALAFAAVSTVAASPAAHAAGGGPEGERRVSLFVFPKGRMPAAEAGLLQGLLRAQLERLVAVRPAGPGGEPEAAVTRLLGDRLERGFRALNDRAGGVAEPLFEEAMRVLTTWEGPVPRRLLARASKGLGVARVMTGDVEGGKVLIEQSMNLVSDQQLSDYGWTLDLRTAFNELVEQRASASTGALEIDVVPEGAAVRINGEFKGFSPLQLDALPPGRHWVEAGTDGHRWQGAFVQVNPGESLMHSVELLPAVNGADIQAAVAALAKAVSKPAGPQLAEVARATGVETVVALEVSSTSNAYVFAGWLRDDKGATRKLQAQFPRDGSFVGRVRTFLADALGSEEVEDDSLTPLDGPPQTSVMAGGDVVIDPNDPIFKGQRAREADSITDTWWFWAIAGSVTAGLVAGGVVLFSGAGDAVGPTGRLVVNVNAVR
jgi:hypothetical protein